MATRVYESGIIPENIDRVWEALRPLNLATILPSAVASSVLEGDARASEVGGVRRVTYKDATVQRVKLVELSDAEYSLTYDVIESVPAVRYLSAIHTIKLRRITSTKHTFVEFTSDYSKDADASVIQDSKFKKLEFLKALKVASESKAAKFFRQLNFAKLEHLTVGQVDAAWRAFDKDGNGILDAAEINTVVDALLTRIATEQATITAALTGIFNDSDAKNEVKAETVTAKIFEALSTRKAALARELVSRLDRNHDGRVDYAEFKALFGAWLEEKIVEGIAAAL
jgi:Ca2+-binding EF-hand superfamily protein